MDATDTRPNVTRDQYDTLRDTELGVSAFLEHALEANPAALEIVRANRRNEATFAAVASWALWEPVRRGTPGVRRRSHAMGPIATHEGSQGALRGGVALVAFNKGLTTLTDVAGRTPPEETPWGNFHSGINDYKLAAAMQEAAAELATTGEPDLLTGCYITDFYKGLPTRDVNEFNEFVELLNPVEAAAVDAEMVRLLLWEFKLLGTGTDTVVVPIGGDADRLVTELVPQVRTVKSPLMHYAAWSYDPDVYQTQVVAINRELKQLLA